jgi:hypothetical protein
MTIYVLLTGEGFRTGRVIGAFSSRDLAEQPLYDLVARERDRADEADDSEGSFGATEREQAILAAYEGRAFADLADLWFDFCGEAYQIAEAILDAPLVLE